MTRVSTPSCFEGILQGEGVLHGGDHADVVAGGAVHAARGGGHAAEDVAAADHDGDVDAQLRATLIVPAISLGGRRVDGPRLAAQRLPAQLEEDAVEGVRLAGAAFHGRHASVAHLAELEAHEAPHLDVLADDADEVGAQLLDGAVGILDEGLLHETGLGEELLELAGDDLLDHVLGLALDLLGVDRLLALDDLAGHLVARHPARGWPRRPAWRGRG